jgi:prolipoprotein diacylglyceryl transferase
MTLLEIPWTVDPEIFSLGGLTIRWYGVLFALGFMTGQYIITKIWNWERQPEEDLDYLLLTMVISVVVGARLGHCLFYEPEYYLSHPIEILKVWKGGLASHGTTVGILLGIWLYANYTMNFSPFYIKKQARPRQSWLYILDRMVIVIALGGAFIRLGNLMNSEIVGSPTTLPWGFRFLKNLDPGVADFARHPSQLYESISCLLLFTFLFWLYNKTREKTPEGRLLGLFMIILFTLRFFYEFIKEDQVDFEAGMMFNMGQLLSIPFILMGMGIFWYSTKQKEKV